jgi:hypothetical protein
LKAQKISQGKNGFLTVFTLVFLSKVLTEGRIQNGLDFEELAPFLI